MKLNRICPICGSSDGKKIKGIHMILQERNPLPNRYDVVCCDKCGFTYADVDCSQKEYNTYYNAFNIHTEALLVENIEVLNVHQKFIDIIFQQGIGKNAKILDIGCGGGELLCMLKDRGYTEICGLDPSEKSIENLNRMGIKGELSNIFDKPKTSLCGKFDVVTSTGVVEHIYDLQGYLKQLQQYIKEDGCIYLLAPAAESFAEFPLPVAAYFNHEHINYFSIFSMDNLMGQFGMCRVNEDVYMERKDEMILTALYKREDRNYAIKRDEISCRTIEEYFKMKAQKENNHRVKEITESKKPVIIFGCGSYSMQILAEYPMLLEQVECFIDNNKEKTGMKFCGKSVKSPEVLNQVDKDTVIAVCSMRNSSDIVNQIRDMHIENEIVNLMM